MAGKEIRAIIKNAPEHKPEPPRPLMREQPPADPFPVDALGKLLGDAAKAIHDKTQAPMAICGQSVLGAATLAVQAYADVVLPTGHARPLSCFFLTIAESGERKSACDALALQPIRTQEWNLRDKYKPSLIDHMNKKDVWEKSRQQILRKVKHENSETKK